METVVFKGDVDPEHIITQLRLDETTPCDEATCWFLDFREARLSLSGEDVKRLGHTVTTRVQPACCEERSHCAAVLVSDDLSFGVFRMLMVYLEDSGVRLRVSRELRLLEEWLSAFTCTESEANHTCGCQT